MTQETLDLTILELELLTGVRNFECDQPRITPPPRIGTYHGGLCVLDRCVETTVVPPKDTVSFVHILLQTCEPMLIMVFDEILNSVN